MDWLESPTDVAGEAAATLIALLLALGVGSLVRLATRGIQDVTSRAFLRRTIDYVLFLITLAICVKIWVRSINLGALFGLTAAGLVLSIKELIMSFAAWVYILVRQPFRVGDRIQIGERVVGDVIDIRLFMFSVLEIGQWVAADQATGRVVHVPNNIVFTQPLANFTESFPHIWNELEVHLTYESDWELARALLLGILHRRMSDPTVTSIPDPNGEENKYARFMGDLHPDVWVAVTRSSVRLSMRYLCDPRQRRVSEHAIWIDVLRAFAQEPRVTLAYPTQRFYNDLAEGAARAQPLRSPD